MIVVLPYRWIEKSESAAVDANPEETFGLIRYGPKSNCGATDDRLWVFVRVVIWHVNQVVPYLML